MKATTKRSIIVVWNYLLAWISIKILINLILPQAYFSLMSQGNNATELTLKEHLKQKQNETKRLVFQLWNCLRHHTKELNYETQIKYVNAEIAQKHQAFPGKTIIPCRVIFSFSILINNSVSNIAFLQRALHDCEDSFRFSRGYSSLSSSTKTSRKKRK